MKGTLCRKGKKPPNKTIGHIADEVPPLYPNYFVANDVTNYMIHCMNEGIRTVSRMSSKDNFEIRTL